MRTELYQVRRPAVRAPREEHMYPFGQDEGRRGELGRGPTNSATPRIPASPVELDSLTGDKWRQFEPPTKELALVEVGTPPEICRIIRESLENQTAARQRFLHDPESSIQEIDTETETENDLNITFVDSATSSTRPATTTTISPTESQHKLQDSTSYSTSASSGVQSNGSSVRNAGLTPSTSRSSNSSRGAQIRNANIPAQKNDINAKQTFSFVPFFGPLPANNKVTGPRQVSPRAAQIKKFWNDRMGEGTALTDESYFPPKCCVVEIPVKVIQGHLSFTQRALYKRKAKEYAVPAGERLFCPYPTCARWNPPSKKVVKYGTIKCTYCRRKICFTCKSEAHEVGTDCPKDFALEATMRQAQRSGWRRCYSCKNMVEKQSGCIHITCKCKAQWCYTCGTQWKTCTCTEEDEVLRQEALEQQADGDDEEAREIAAAIADIQRQEREEVERALARAEEEAREAARRREGEQRWSRHAKEQAERVEVQRLRATADELNSLWIALHRVHRMQRRILLQRHAETRSELGLTATETRAAYPRTCLMGEPDFRTQYSEPMQEIRDTFTVQPLHRRQIGDGYWALQAPNLSTDGSRERDAEGSHSRTTYAQRLRGMQSSTATAREAEKMRGKEALDQQELQQVADLMWFEALVDERSRMLEDLEALMVSPPLIAAQA